MPNDSRPIWSILPVCDQHLATARHAAVLAVGLDVGRIIYDESLMPTTTVDKAVSCQQCSRFARHMVSVILQR